MVKISIITVTYNSEEFISTCINSVLTQSYHDFEYIVIDGNSKDNTIEIIKKHPQIKYISEPDKGIYDAINKGIQIAAGDIIGVLNSDDFFANQHILKTIASTFAKDNSLDAVFADIAFVARHDTSKVTRYYSSKLFKPWMFKFGFQPAHPSFYAKKILFEKYGNYRDDLKISGDFELMLRFLFIHKIRYKYVEDVWVKMRVGGVSTSGVKSLVKLNREIFLALQINNITASLPLLYSKYLIKWWGFIFKK